MKVLFYILSLLAIAGAAYFSNLNKADMLLQQETRVKTINMNRNVSAQADKTEGQLKVEQTKLTSAKQENAEVVQSIASLEGKASGLKRELGEIEGELEEQQATLRQAEDARVAAEAALREVGIQGPVTMDNIADSMKQLEDQKKQLTQDLGELETLIDAAKKNVDRNRQNIDRLAGKKSERDARIRNNAMQAEIRAVNQDWGFVVIGAGRNTGFTPQTKLLVKRNGRVVGEVKPSSIEANQTIAEIDYETLAPGAVIRAGDRVILAKLAAN